MDFRRVTRRDFLGSVAAAAALPAVFRGDPYRPIPASRLHPAAPVRVRGRVAAAGRGLARVAVTDGLTVVTTDRDGRYELVTDRSRGFVSVSLPAGHAVPVGPSGTARCYRRIEAPASGEMAASFDLLPVAGGDERHAFLALADIQTQNPADMARFGDQSVPAIRSALAGFGDRPAFAVGLGDIMWDNLALFDDYESAARGLGVPFFQVVGNHDLDLEAQSDGASTATFERRFGPRYYSFNRGEIHYVVLDDVFYHAGGYIGYVDDDQLRWLAADLALVERGTPVVVFAHIPLLSYPGRSDTVAARVTNRDAVYRLLAPYRATILSGHIHDNETAVNGSTREHNLGAVCGGWWTGDISRDGSPNGFGVFEAAGGELRWRYQATGAAPGHQIRVYPRGADPTAPEEFVANVWAWAPGWTVRWYRDGQPMGPMARRLGLDPLAVGTLAGAEKPGARGWVDPTPTSHLFYAPLAAGPGVVRVEAIDPAGTVFTADLR